MTTKLLQKRFTSVRSKRFCVKKRYRSPLFAAIHETVENLHEAGIMDTLTMRHFDVMCLTPVKPMDPEKIAAIRKREMASQTVFARYLGVSTNLISQWERGEKKPQGASLKLPALLEKNGLASVA